MAAAWVTSTLYAMPFLLLLLVGGVLGVSNSELPGRDKRQADKTKVFFLGPHKTGTESFHNFLRRHGYNSVHDAGRSCQTLGLGTVDENFRMGPYDGDGSITDVEAWVADKEHLYRFRVYVREHDAFTDTPWFLLYKLADREFPGSKFVLATRDTEDWLRSQRNAFLTRTAKTRMWIYGYGSVAGHEDRYREVYEQHAQDVLDYFGPDRLGKDLLVFRLGEESNEEVTARLNDFLGLDASKGLTMGHDHVTKAQVVDKAMRLERKGGGLSSRSASATA